VPTPPASPTAATIPSPEPTPTPTKGVLSMLDARWRSIIYLLFTVVSVGLGSFQVWYGATASSTPTWLKGALAVVAYLGGAIGITAALYASDS
jgi:protein-S-isoprenylcysteine O-methyltransferase Ste14